MRIPPARILKAPIDRWDEAIPLGNGLVGLLVWGEGRTIRLSLDRGDLWDLRQPPEIFSPDFTAARLAKWIKAGNQGAITELFCAAASKHPFPTKLPAGRVELTISKGAVESFELDYRSGACTVRFDNGGRLEICLPPEKSGFILRADGVEFRARLTPPKRAAAGHGNGEMGCVTIDSLGYPPAKTGPGWMIQETDGTAHAICLCREGAEWAASIEKDPTRALDQARATARDLLEAGFDRALKSSRKWWRAHWSASSVRVPDALVQSAYDFAQYTYGACSRRGSPPIPLQGLWTADDGTLPPWRGDYHNDLNVQLTYWAALPANRPGCDLAMLDFFWDLLPAHRDLAARIWDAPGAWVPGVMALDGQLIGSWAQYVMSPTAGAWIAWHFHRHWKLTGDKTFLRERALPYCAAIGEFLLGVMKPGTDGLLRLPFSASPEIHNDRIEAWLKPDSNYDLALTRRLFAALAEMEPRNRRWKETLARLPQLAVSDRAWSDWESREGTGALLLAPGEELAESHRHHSHLMAVYPLGLLSPDKPRDAEIIDQSLRQLERLGTMFWCGYSFAWSACLHARAGFAEAALHALRVFQSATCTRNGFHLNGDFQRTGVTAWHYRPFTLEGNLAAAEAVHEMLVQSHGGTLRLFPATPDGWADAEFENLRVEGGWLVSAKRRHGGLAAVRVDAPPGGGVLRLRAGGAALKWNRPVRRSGRDLVFKLTANDQLIGKIP
jgi:alpha-L-fucosidase 2